MSKVNVGREATAMRVTADTAIYKAALMEVGRADLADLAERVELGERTGPIPPPDIAVVVKAWRLAHRAAGCDGEFTEEESDQFPQYPDQVCSNCGKYRWGA